MRKRVHLGFGARGAGQRAQWEQIMACYLAECDEVDVALRWDVVRVQRIGENRAMISHLVNAWSGLA